MPPMERQMFGRSRAEKVAPGAGEQLRVEHIVGTTLKVRGCAVLAITGLRCWPARTTSAGSAGCATWRLNSPCRTDDHADSHINTKQLKREVDGMKLVTAIIRSDSSMS